MVSLSLYRLMNLPIVKYYGKIRAKLQKFKTIIDSLDMLISAHIFI
jgi:hypothetical protein